MLHQTRRVVLGAFLALIVFAGSLSPAAAECAWVLWASTYCTLGPACKWRDYVRPMTAFNTKQECDAESKRLEEVTRPPEETYYKCLPDTVDLRGPKKPED